MARQADDQLIQLGDLSIEVVRKHIKHVHLSVYPPAGRVTMSVPLRMNAEALRAFAISRLSWIRQQQKKILQQERETQRDYVSGESHYLWGKRYLLTVTEHDGAPVIHKKHATLLMQVRPGTGREKRQEVMADWYREQLKSALPELIAHWEPVIGVKVDRFFIQHMKTRWGSCNPSAKSIRLNTELVKKPRECLEYIVVHELVHILEPSHNSRFVSLMDQFMPGWQHHRDKLNRLPVRHEDWVY
jgi:predicted metal-dependent hydrolase